MSTPRHTSESKSDDSAHAKRERAGNGRDGDGSAIEAAPLPGGPEPLWIIAEPRLPLADRRAAATAIGRTYGNRQLTRMLGGVVQRVPITAPNAPENLLQPYDQSNVATQDFRSHSYGGGDVNYETTRASETEANVTVRIKFVRKVNPGDPATEVPEGPTRDFARTQCTALVTFWNGKFVLVGTKTPDVAAPASGVTPASPGGPPPASPPIPPRAVAGPPAPGGAAPAGGAPPAATPTPNEAQIRLTFSATPVFGLGETAHKTIALHDEVTADGSALPSTATTVPGQPRSRRIDSGNWFVNKNNLVYPASQQSIYAHEYGHLLGIPDEYSLSNPDMHALFHDVSPQRETQMNNALDKAAIRQMVLSAIAPVMQPLVSNLAGAASSAVAEQTPAIEKHISKGLRQGWRQPTLVPAAADLIRPQFEAAGKDGLARSVRSTLRFEALDNLSNVTIANEVVPAELQPAAIRAILDAAYTSATTSLSRSTVAIPYLTNTGANASMNVDINMAPAATGTASPLNAAATTLATASTGTPQAAPPGGRHAPSLYPSQSLIGRLTAMPASWANAATLMDAQTSTMESKILQAVTARLAATDLSATVTTVRDLYQQIYAMVGEVSRGVCQATVREFLTAQIGPLVQGQVTDLVSLVEREVDSHQTAVGTGTNAAPGTPPDPAVQAAVTVIEAQARAMLGPQTAGGTTSYNVSFTVQSQMGGNAQSSSIRTDQMTRVATSFNSKPELLRHGEIAPFTVRAAP